MQQREIDKTKWARGPWDNEPDFIDGTDDATGYPVVMSRNHSGIWCGYVGVPKGHPSYGLGYDSVDVNVHGGLTYSDEQFKEDVHWFGFDCAHWNDQVPLLMALDPGVTEGIYRDINFVKREVASLAKQLKEIADGTA